jgi:hypothetical protein
MRLGMRHEGAVLPYLQIDLWLARRCCGFVALHDGQGQIWNVVARVALAWTAGSSTHHQLIEG